MNHWRWTTGSFDAIISVGVFSYVEKFDTCFDEMVSPGPPRSFYSSSLIE